MNKNRIISISIISSVLLFIITSELLYSNKKIIKKDRLLEFWKQRWEAENWFLIKTKKELNQLKYNK